MIEQKKLKNLTPDVNNANKGTERGRNLLEKSLREYGAGRSILIDKNMRIIAGNKTAEEAGAIGLDDVIIVKTDGKKLVAVQRTDLDLTKDKAARELAYADNRISELDFDVDVLQMQEDLAAGIEIPGYSDEEIAELMADVSAVDFKEYNESVENEVEYLECPECGHKWPK